MLSSAKVNHSASAKCDECSGSSHHELVVARPCEASYIGCRLSEELHTSCVCSCITLTLDKHDNTCQTVYPQFLHSVADTGCRWGRLAQRGLRSAKNKHYISRTRFLLLRPSHLEHSSFRLAQHYWQTQVHSDSRVHFSIVLTTAPGTCRIATPCKFHVHLFVYLLINTKIPI